MDSTGTKDGRERGRFALYAILWAMLWVACFPLALALWLGLAALGDA